MANHTFHFTHYKLDAYRVSRELADHVIDITRQVPQGHAKMVDQIVRAATGAEALIAEGANRYTPKQKRQPCTGDGREAHVGTRNREGSERSSRPAAKQARSPRIWSGSVGIGSSPRSN